MNTTETLKKKGVEISNSSHNFSPLCRLYTTPPVLSAILVEVKGIEPSRKDYLKIALNNHMTTTMPIQKIGNYGSQLKTNKVKTTLHTDTFARNETTETPAANRRLAQWRVTWLIEHSTSHQLLWCIDSFVLRNPPLRQAPKRYRQ
jgi:hypothetical protein